MRKINLFILSTLLAGTIVTFDASSQCSYDKSRTLTINSSQVAGSTDLVDFAVLVSFSNTQLATVANGGYVQNNNGYDIRFMLKSCDCWLDHQIESYNPATGAYSAWVRIPALKATENTLLEMYYGNAAIVTDPSTDQVWTTDYVGVWHLNENPSGAAPQHTDASGTGNNGTAEGTNITSVTGKSGNAVVFNGTNDLIEVPDDATLDLTTSLTLSLWFDLDGQSTENDYPTLLGKGQSFTTDNGYGLLAGDITVPTAAGMIANPGRVITADLALTDFNDGNWHHMTATYDGANFVFYFDGAQAATVASAITITTQNDPLHIGDGSDNGHWNGKIDEVRISNAVKSADWIATEFANINNPATFMTLGAQKEGNCTGPGGVGQTDGTTNLALWLKADCGVENNNHESVGDGQGVGIWRDQSGYGVDATEATNQPEYATNQVEGQPAINFIPGNGDRLLAAGVNDTDNFTIFIVASATGFGPSANPGLLHASPIGSEFSGNADSKSIGMWVSNGGVFWGRIVESDGTVNSYTQNAAVDLDTYYIMANYANGLGTTGQYIRGSDASGSIGYDNTVQSWTQFGIGRQAGETWNGYIAEVIVYNSYLSDSDRALVENYLSTKYGAEIPRLSGSTGPGGLGNTDGSSRLETWYDALDLDADGKFEGTSEGGQAAGIVSTWFDKSGNDYDLSTGSASYTTAANTDLNNFPRVTFNGTTEYLQTADIQIADLGLLEYFIVFDNAAVNGANNTALLTWETIGNVGGFSLEARAAAGTIRNKHYDGMYFNNDVTGFTTTAPYIYNARFGASGREFIRNGTSIASNATAIDLNNPAAAPLSMGRNFSNSGNYFAAQVAEMFVFSTELNNAEKQIAQQYLSEKYNVALGGTDYYTGHSGTFDYEVQGIGTSDGTLINSHVESNASNGLTIAMANGTFNGANEYVFTGYEDPVDGTSTSDLVGAVEQRFRRVWYLDKTGTVDVKLTFNIQEVVGGGGFPAGDGYVLMYSSTAAPYAFSDWTSNVPNIAATVANELISFTITNADLVDGYYTVGTTDAVNNPLPVELTYFRTQLCGNQACMNWQTASELNNDFFEIQKSQDGEEWLTIGKVQGAGTINSKSDYSYTDYSPFFGKSYYRLKQVDFDGQFAYSPIESISYLSNPEISVYPNPSKSYFTLSGTDIADMDIYLTNVSGHKVSFTTQVISTSQIIVDLGQNPGGVYLLSVLLNQSTTTKRIMYMPN